VVGCGNDRYTEYEPSRRRSNLRIGSHDNRNLPIVLNGGGFRHGQRLAFDQNYNEPLANLYGTMLQRLGLEIDQFSANTGKLSGLEIAGSNEIIA
jgi:hypothetical protein